MRLFGFLSNSRIGFNFSISFYCNGSYSIAFLPLQYTSYFLTFTLSDEGDHARETSVAVIDSVLSPSGIEGADISAMVSADSTTAGRIIAGYIKCLDCKIISSARRKPLACVTCCRSWRLIVCNCCHT